MTITVDSIKPKDIMSLTDFVKVNSVTKDPTNTKHDVVSVTDLDTGRSFNIIGTDLIGDMKSADRHSSSLKVSRTELAKIFTHAFNTVFTVRYKKKNGLLRVLRGRLVQPEPLMGRSHVEDLDLDDNRMRLVDHRTLDSLIFNGVKYYV